MGLNPAQLDDLRGALVGAGEGGEAGVWPDHVGIVEAFLSVATQWRTVAIGSATRWIGLDYTAVKAGLDALGTVVTPDLWAGLLIMEGAATEALNEPD